MNICKNGESTLENNKDKKGSALPQKKHQPQRCCSHQK